ncbi:MAG: HD domain-containing protein, partial [Planctomycetota bacterium]|nr:HD domain-containing protein [Planctomycetota bacterium]
MSVIREIPEIAGLDARQSLLRIPQELDVPLTPRVRSLIDTAEFRRLSKVSQLGLVTLVYPGATHTRFEHSLGVYRLALLFLKQLSYDERFAATVQPEEAEALIAAALLHDLGHWPYCHPIEDLQLPGVPRHERLAERYLLTSQVGEILQREWRISPEKVLSLLNDKGESPSSRILSSILSCPIDIDKMDYLSRDSLHAGVPYGRHFDQQRLIGSLCLNEAGDNLAITDKGRTAAEMMVFARYVMFSEVYWHHT